MNHAVASRVSWHVVGLIAGLSVAGLGACHSSSADPFDPVSPGGGSTPPIGMQPPGGGTTDGGASDALNDGGILISGRVCIPKDLRQLTVCDDTADASGLTVTLGTRTTTTLDKTGAFTIEAPQGAGFTWHVIGPKINNKFFTSVMPFGTNNTIPVLGDITYTELLDQNNAVLNDQEGSVFVRVVSGLAPVSGVIATSNPPLDQGTVLYDSNDQLRWDINHTEAFGAAWFPAMPLLPTPAKITLQPPLAAVPVTTDVVIENQSITFITVDLQ